MSKLAENLAIIFAEWARRLRIMALDAPATMLFCARAGLRLRILAETVSNNSGWDMSSTKHVDFMMSRLLAVKCALAVAPEPASNIIAAEFRGKSLGCALKALGSDSFQESENNITPDNFRAYLNSQSGTQLRENALIQHRLVAERLAFDIGGSKRVIIVDSGLFGSIHFLLQQAFPEWDWYGAYFGRSNYRKLAAPHFAKSLGLVFQSDHWVPSRPETSFLRHWHLIEDLLEPDLPSVQEYLPRQPWPKSNLEEDPRWPLSLKARSGLWDQVINAGEHMPTLDPEQQVPEYDYAISYMARLILAPRPRELADLVSGVRSHDFGREGGVSGLLTSDTCPGSRFQRVKEALWHEGQAVEEFGVAASSLLYVRMHLLTALHLLRNRDVFFERGRRRTNHE